MSVYQREGSPYWQYDFTVNGSRFRGSTGETGKRQAQVREAELKHDARQRRTYQDEWRLRDCFGAYWNEHAKHKPSCDNAWVALEKLFGSLGEDTPIMSITNANLMDYRAVQRGYGMSAATINRDFAYLRAALNHAKNLHRKDIPALAWSRVRLNDDPHRTRFLAREEYDRLIAAAHEAIRPIIAFAVCTGLRKENILSLKWSQIDMASGWITVILKGNKRHSIRLSAAAKAALSGLGDRTGAVFDRTNFRKRWDAALRDAEIEDFCFHDLRHTFASWARQAGADIADICEALGHSDISVTMRYAHIKPDEQITAFDRVSANFTTQSTSHSYRRIG